MVRIAIKPMGVGEIPGHRVIHEGAPLDDGEVFAVSESDYGEFLRLGADGVSLRKETVAERVERERPLTVQDRLGRRLARDPLLRRVINVLAGKFGVTAAELRADIVAEP